MCVCVCTCQVCVLGALGLRQCHQLSEQQRILEDSLNRFDQERLQRRRVLIGRIPALQEVFEGTICLCWRKEAEVYISLPV